MKRFAIFIILGLALALSACSNISINLGNTVRGSGNMSSETRPVSGFTQISIDGSGDAQITQGDTESLKIEAEDNILPLVTSEVVGGKLVLGLKPMTSISTTRTIHYTITVKDLSALALNGSGNVSAGALKSTSMALNLNGSGDISLASLEGSSLSVSGNGSGNFSINAGKIDNQSIQLFGSGSIQAANLESQTASVTIAGSGSASLWVKGSLNVSIGGSGNVDYYGAPTVTQAVAGSGRINGRGSK